MKSILSLLALAALSAAAQSPAPQGAVVAFAISTNNDIDVAVQALDMDGKQTWGKGGVPLVVSDSGDNESAPAICPDGVGGYFVAFEYEFTSGDHKGDRDVVVQRIDANGRPLWDEPIGVGGSENRESSPQVVADGKGGAYVAFVWADQEGDSDVMIQRIDADGKQLWNKGEQATPLAASDEIEKNFHMVSDGRGGAILAYEWQEGRNDSDVVVERIMPDGSLPWRKDGKVVAVGDSGDFERNPSVVADETGGAIIAFEFEAKEGEAKGDIEVVAQRVSADGRKIWGENQLPVAVMSTTNWERRPIAVSDGANGALIIAEVEVKSGEFTGDRDVMAQRVNDMGQIQWNNGEVSSPVSDSVEAEFSPVAISDGKGGVIVAFETEVKDAKEGDIYAVRLSAQGKPVWGQEPLALANSKWNERQPRMLPDGTGGFFAAIMMNDFKDGSPTDSDLGMMRISAEGKALWNEGKQLSAISFTQSNERSAAIAPRLPKP